MTATFGQLQGRTLELREGLNILQAPNESGKSTWCAFLLSILYGVNSRERDRAGFLADKNRYAPWSGEPMSGRLECAADLGELTLTRTTRRAGSPMGEFRAVYAGTGEPAAGLTGANCGETLLGVSREVFERSAFIRQNGLAVTQDAELERRIAALISSGEEDTSYTEAQEALRRQLNRRRHNRTGRLPALEAEREGLSRQLEACRALSGQLTQARRSAAALEEREAALREELAACARWEQAQKRQALAAAEAEAAAAQERAEALRAQLAEARIPETDAIARLRGAIVNLETTRKAVDKARAERDEAMKALLRAEAAAGESPFAGQTPEHARKEAAAPPVPDSWRKGPGLLLITLGTIAAFVLFYMTGAALSGSPWQKPAALAVLLAALGVTYFLAGRLRRKAIQKAQASVLLKRFGTADLAAIQKTAEAYAGLCQARDSAQAEAGAKSAAADTLYNTLTSNEQAILLEVRRFAPAAFDIPAADRLLRESAVRRKELAEAEAALREARLRRELLAQQAPENAGEPADGAPPARDRGTVSAELEAARAALAAARTQADRLEGQLRAAGDPAALEASIRELSEQIDALEGEYRAIALALEALERANAALQSRFSPALGRRAAEIFGRLTDGRYSAVALDRSLHLEAEPAGGAVFRDAAYLSAGALDQLYLAVRLAICDLVLPAETCPPIILDDALANFDDGRCAAALHFLKEEAGRRQILLFTCHSREADFFAGDGEVFVQRLTQGTSGV